MKPPTGRRRDYVPCTKPGSRLPHMNVRLLPSVSSKEPLSTLDLISLDKIEFLLIIAPLAESYNLARAAFEAAKEIGISLRVCIMWPDGTRDGAEAGSVKALAPWKNYIDVAEVRGSTSISWWDICQMSQNGAILVRPDDHIAWRAKEGVLANPYTDMERVLSTVLTLK